MPLNIAVTENWMGYRCLGQVLASVGWVTSRLQWIVVTTNEAQGADVLFAGLIFSLLGYKLIHSTSYTLFSMEH
jgi:hypothetical protein